MEIYLCDLTEINVKKSYDELIGCLEEDSRAAIERYRFPAGRLTAFVREIMLRYVFYKAFGEVGIGLSKNQYGKPYITGIKDSNKRPYDKSTYEDMDFNISHSGDIVAIISGKGRAGIDVERNDRIKDYAKLTRFLYESEAKRVEGSADPEKEFCRIWTFREAFSKEEGVGLSLFEDKDIRIDYDNNSVIYTGKSCRFYEYEYPGYNLTCCVAEGISEPELIKTDEKLWDEMTSVFAKIHISVLY